MKILMNAYCDRNSLDFNSMTFLSNGHRILPHQTPYEVCLSLTCSFLLLLGLNMFAMSVNQNWYFIKNNNIFYFYFYTLQYCWVLAWKNIYILMQLDLEDEDEIYAVLYQQWTERINIKVKGQVRPFFRVLGRSNVDFFFCWINIQFGWFP